MRPIRTDRTPPQPAERSVTPRWAERFGHVLIGATMQITLNVNGGTREVDVDPTTPLLWVLRDHLGMTGTKFGCGIAMCGACTVHLNGSATRSCRVPVEAVAGVQITTIEGLAPDASHPLQQVWLELN